MTMLGRVLKTGPLGVGFEAMPGSLFSAFASRKAEDIVESFAMAMRISEARVLKPVHRRARAKAHARLSQDKQPAPRRAFRHSPRAQLRAGVLYPHGGVHHIFGQAGLPIDQRRPIQDQSPSWSPNAS